MIASCIFPFHRATLLQHWLVYNRAWPLSSSGCPQINWNWTQIKLNSSSLGMNGNGAKNISMFPIELLGIETYPAKSARNLGVIFDKNFNFRSHIFAICSSCIYHIRDLQRIRRHLDLDSAKLLAYALVSSHLDYCNLVLSGIAETDHQAPMYLELSGLCGHKVTTIYSQCSTAALPLLATSKIQSPFQDLVADLQSSSWGTTCLPSLLDCHFSSITFTESNRGISLSVPRIKTITGVRVFSSCTPSLWNNLPPSVHSATSVANFKRHLKTYLFDLAFPL